MERWCDLPPTAHFRDWVWLLFCGVVFVVGQLGEEEDDVVVEVPKKWFQGRRFFRFGRKGGRRDKQPRRLGLGLVFLLLLGFGGHRQSWAIGNIAPKFHPNLPPQRAATTRPRRHRIYWTLAASLFYLFHLRSCAASAVGARQSGNTLGLVEGEFVPLLRDIFQGVNQLFDPLQEVVQGLYFCLLAIWVAKFGDVCKGSVLVFGIGAWVMEQHLLTELRNLVSLEGVSWLTADFPLLGRIFLTLLVWCFPAYPGRSIFPNLRASQSAMAMEINEGMDVGLAAASQFGVAYKANDADLASAELFGVEVGEILGSGNGVRSHGNPREFYCPIQGCARSRGQGPAWTSKDALRAHLDMHLLGELQGRPSDEVLQDMGLRCCRVCGNSMSQKHTSGIHPSCWPKVRDPIRDSFSLPLNETQLPSLSEIFTTPIFTEDQLGRW